MIEVEGRKTAMLLPPTLAALAALMLGLSAPCWSEEAAIAEPPTPDAATPRVSHHQPARRMSIAQSIDERVSRLARGLDLDDGQQVRLREILVNQQRQMMQLRSGGAGSGDVTGTLLAIYDQTRARIRAILNDAQLKKYPAAVPREQTAPAQADLKHWMDQQESRQ